MKPKKNKKNSDKFISEIFLNFIFICLTLYFCYTICRDLMTRSKISYENKTGAITIEFGIDFIHIIELLIILGSVLFMIVSIIRIWLFFKRKEDYKIIFFKDDINKFFNISQKILFAFIFYSWLTAFLYLFNGMFG